MNPRKKITNTVDFIKDKIPTFNKSVSGSNFYFKDEKKQLFDSIEKAYSDLEQAQYTFNQISDSAAIDYASYGVLAAEAKYTYLLNKAKEKGIRL